MQGRDDGTQHCLHTGLYARALYRMYCRGKIPAALMDCTHGLHSGALQGCGHFMNNFG